MKFQQRCCVYAFALLIGCSASTSVYAQDAATTPPATSAESTDAEEAAEAEKMRPTIDLGKFVIKDLRPARNETAKVTFSVHLAFSKELTEEQVAKLEGWKHRLRDQVIIATRISYLVDFQEPDLSLFRRKILIRVNRALKAKVAEEVLLTEYLFRLH